MTKQILGMENKRNSGTDPFTLCFVLALSTPRFPWICPLLTLIMIYPGVGTDAMTDKTMDRNLWGLEAIIAQIMSLPGLVVGGGAGGLLSRRVWRKQKAQQNHYSECGRATSVANSGAMGRPHR